MGAKAKLNRPRNRRAPSVDRGERTRRHRGVRWWAFRVAAACGAPVLVALVLEGVLRLSGYGYPTTFALTRKGESTERLVQNEQFGWRFFPPRLARSPYPFDFPAKKAHGAYRIFVLGGSAAQGDPDPAFGLSRMLSAILERRYPGARFEVINAAMVAVNSHIVREIARECTEYEPDMIIVYLGNNEVVGPFGAGTVFGKRTPPHWLIRGNLLVKRLRLGQGLFALMGRRPSVEAEFQTWGGMEMFMDRQVAASDPALLTVYDHFSRNLEDILNAGRRAGSAVLLCTVATNERDCAPFASMNRADLRGRELDAWTEGRSRGDALFEARQYADALQEYESIAAIDDQYALTHFRIGRCLDALGRANEADRAYRRARDLDTLRFRADSRINDCIRAAVHGRADPRVKLVDVVQRFEAGSPRLRLGNQLFHDHVHFNFPGNHRLASLLAEAVEDSLPGSIRGDAPEHAGGLEPENLAGRLVYTDWSDYRISQLMLEKRSKPPFTGQFENVLEIERLERSLDELRARLDDESAEIIDKQFSELTARHPEDWVLEFNHATFLTQRLNRPDKAARRLERITGMVPHLPRAFANLALVENLRDRPERAAAAARKALEIDPNLDGAMNSLAYALSRLGETDRALETYHRLLERNPAHGEARRNLIVLLEKIGETQAAQEQIDVALRLEPDPVSLHLQLGQAIERQGDDKLAATHYQLAARAAPDAIEPKLALGNAYLRAGDLKNAATNFEDVLRLDGDHLESLFNLGAIYFEFTDWPRAIDHFARLLERQPDMDEARFKLALASKRAGRIDSAIKHFRVLANRSAPDPSVLTPLADCLTIADQLEEAAELYERLAAMQPDAAEPLFKLGLIRSRLGNLDGGIESLRRAVRISPEIPIVHYHLGRVLMDAADVDGALAAYREANRLAPQNPEFALALAWLLATEESPGRANGKEAVRLAQSARSQLNNDQPDALNVLAAAYAAAGRYDDAVRTAQRAITLAQEAGRTGLAQTIQRHAQTYRRARSLQGVPTR